LYLSTSSSATLYSDSNPKLKLAVITAIYILLTSTRSAIEEEEEENGSSTARLSAAKHRSISDLHLLTIADYFYEEVSLNEWFALDHGKFGTFVAEQLYDVILQIFYSFLPAQDSPILALVMSQGTSIAECAIKSKVYNKSQWRNLLSVLAQVCYDLYAIPSSLAQIRKTNTMPNNGGFMNAKSKSIPDRVVPIIYEFIKLAEITSTSGKGDIRAALQMLHRHSALKSPPTATYQSCIEQYMFNDSHQYDISFLTDNIDSIAASSRVAEEEESLTSPSPSIISYREHGFCTQEALTYIRVSFYHELAKVGVSESADSAAAGMSGSKVASNGTYFGTLADETGLLNTERKVLPLIEILLFDLYRNPYRFESWWRLLCGLIESYHTVTDLIGDLGSPDYLFGASNGLKDCDRATGRSPSLLNELKDAISPFRVTHVSDSLTDSTEHHKERSQRKSSLISLLKRNDATIELIRRTIVAIDQVFNFIPETAGEKNDAWLKSNESYEMMGMVLYNNSLLYEKRSERRKEIATEALWFFKQGMRPLDS
jgi:hypothetical protein